MGIRDWLASRKARAEQTKKSVEINEDEALIRENAPEIAGMGFVEGGAFILKQQDNFRASCTTDQAQELNRRLKESNASWEAEDLTMPYWGTLVVLRTYQAELNELQ